MYREYSFELALYTDFVIILLLLIAKPYRSYININTNNNRGKTTSFLFFLIYITVTIFSFNKYDTYHYMGQFLEAKKYLAHKTELYEAFYNWLAYVLDNSFVLWRIVIWGTAGLFTYFTAKRLKLVNNGNFFLALILFGFGFGIETRGVLGHTMLLLGLVLLVDKNRDNFIKYIGITLFVCSYFFHKSMYANIAFAILAFLPIFNKKNVVISLIVFPFLTVAATWLVNSLSSGFLEISFAEGVGGVGDRTMRYVTEEKQVFNLNGLIERLVIYIPEYLTLYYITDRVIYKKYLSGITQERVFTYLFQLTYVIIYIASLFAFVETSKWIYVRFKAMAFFPLVFILAKIWSLEPHTNKWVKRIIVLQLLSLGWQLSLTLYNWYRL